MPRLLPKLVSSLNHLQTALLTFLVFSGLNVLGLYHDFILVKAVAKNGKKQLHQPSPHNRYTRYWVNASSNYKRLALMLTIIQYSQVLIEMGVIKRWGKETRWKLVLGVEMLKAATRLYLVRLTQGRAVVHPPVPEREIDPASLEDAEQHSNHSSIQHPLLGGLNANGNGHAMNGSSAHIHQNGANIESAYRNLHELNGHSVDNYLLSKVLKADDVKPAKDLLRPLPSLGKLAEGMHIMRPLFYVLAIRKYGERSWRPWFVSLLCELASRQLAQQARNFKMETSLEAEEQRRRTWALLWSCFRGPFYAEYTK